MTPTCDICNGTEDDGYDGYQISEWNGETGCHVLCEIFDNSLSV